MSLSLVQRSALLLSRHFLPNLNYYAKRQKRDSLCDICLQGPPKKPCFDHRNLVIERAHANQAALIKSFLYTHYWPREPSVAGLWMCPNSAYLDILSEKYSRSGDRYLAFEVNPKTKEKKLVGVTVANKVFPLAAQELEDWAHRTVSKPEQYRMRFCAHCLKTPNLFRKYNVGFVYTVDILGTAAEVSAQGVGKRLLQNVLDCAADFRYPLVQVVSNNSYASKICEKCGMTREWSMEYEEFVDNAGHRLFYPRSPHRLVRVYVKYLDPVRATGARVKSKPAP